MRFVIAVAVFLLGLSMCAPGSYAEEEAKQEVRVVRGKISSVNWVGREVVVNNGIGDMIPISISSDTRMIRGGKKISLSDVLIMDPVVVWYFENDDGELEATRLADNNLAGN